MRCRYGTVGTVPHLRYRTVPTVHSYLEILKSEENAGLRHIVMRNSPFECFDIREKYRKVRKFGHSDNHSNKTVGAAHLKYIILNFFHFK